MWKTICPDGGGLGGWRGARQLIGNAQSTMEGLGGQQNVGKTGSLDAFKEALLLC